MHPYYGAEFDLKTLFQVEGEDYVPTPHSATYNSYFPFPESPWAGLGPKPDYETDPDALLAWNEEYSRRTLANRAAVADLHAGAEAGYCEPCEAVTLIYAEKQRDQSEWIAAHPHQARMASFLQIPNAPAACASCIPQPANVPLAARMEEIPWVPLGIAAVLGFFLARRI